MENFKADLTRKELIPIKILMFLIYGGQATLYPYFTVHLRSLGVSIRQTAIIFAVQPIIALIVAPMVGMAADKIGNFKIIFSFFLTFSAVTANLLLLVPPVSLPRHPLHLDVSCESNQAVLRVKTGSCDLAEAYGNGLMNVSVTADCRYSCDGAGVPFLPLLLSKDDCSHQCGAVLKSSCRSISANALLNVYLNTSGLDKVISSILPESSYSFGLEGIEYDALQCACDRCSVNCSLVPQSPADACKDDSDEDFGVTFFSYLGIRLVVTLGIGLVNGLFDAASMTIIQDLKADVGFQRFWSTVAMCICAPISGHLVDVSGSFRPCFFMYGGLYLLAALISLKLDLSMKLPSDNALHNLGRLLSNAEVLILLVQIAVLGICWGFLENYLFWFLESELDSNNLIMGLTVTVGSGTGLVMALVATWSTRKLGYVNVIVLAFAAYTVRFIGYSYAQDAYTCLIFEMMENFTVTLLTVGVTMYCTELASMEMLTTIMTLWNGLHIISGRAFGSLLGGFLVRTHGFRKTFRYFAAISFSFGVLYSLVYVLWLRKWRKLHRRESTDKERRESEYPDEKEDEAMKMEAFSSLRMHCSFDSPSIMHFVPDSPDLELRRRALSHVPTVRRSSSLQMAKRHALSFSGGNETSLSVIAEPPPTPNYSQPPTPKLNLTTF